MTNEPKDPTPPTIPAPMADDSVAQTNPHPSRLGLFDLPKPPAPAPPDEGPSDEGPSMDPTDLLRRFGF